MCLLGTSQSCQRKRLAPNERFREDLWVWPFKEIYPFICLIALIVTGWILMGTCFPNMYESSLYSCYVNWTVPKEVLHPRLVFRLNIIYENVGAKCRQSCQNAGFLCDKDIAFPFIKNALLKKIIFILQGPSKQKAEGGQRKQHVLFWDELARRSQTQTLQDLGRERLHYLPSARGVTAQACKTAETEHGALSDIPLCPLTARAALRPSQWGQWEGRGGLGSVLGAGLAESGNTDLCLGQQLAAEHQPFQPNMQQSAVAFRMGWLITLLSPCFLSSSVKTTSTTYSQYQVLFISGDFYYFYFPRPLFSPKR